MTSVAHILTTGVSLSDLSNRAALSLEKLLQVKDPSIQAFVRTFVGCVKTKSLSEDLRGRFQRSLALQTTLCKASKDGDDSKMSYLQKKRVKRAVRNAMEKELET